jgi:glycosyltransferase involved in cell wall biosynthesis
MRLLVNTLSIGSLSGQHVLFGHVSQLARWTQGTHEYVLLHESGHSDFVRAALPFQNVSLAEAPNAMGWTRRSAWEAFALPALMKRHGVDLYFTPSGTILPRSPIPQICLAQNPWCMVPQVHRNSKERLKATLQRTAYRHAFRHADLMVYNSEHIRSLYSKNSPRSNAGENLIVFQGINDVTHEIAAKRREQNDRKPLSILSVSAMAHWKGAETVVGAVAELRRRGIEATLCLVGPWPDHIYEKTIRCQVTSLGLDGVVTITGKVSVKELHDYYSTSQVFCLMSQCESFGIPAVEAQAFGTPVVGSNTCAMEEIGGCGGVYGQPGDSLLAADLLSPLLTDKNHWLELSRNAVTNSQRFRWEECSKPLLGMFDLQSPTNRSADTEACVDCTHTSG